jgi:BioD-like phosphotransacetylase family protein
MPALQVLSTTPLSGKTTIAVALARGLANDGVRVRLARVGSGEAAAEDAATFAEYLFATAEVRPLTSVPAVPRDQTAIVELDAGAQPAAKWPAIIVTADAPSEADRNLAQLLGDSLVGSIATDIAPTAIEDVARELTNGGMRVLAVIPEDRVLASPSVGEIGATLGARVLYAGENEREVVEDVLLAPVFLDPARAHFRRFAAKAVLAPFNKTDLHLVAIETQAACLVITGGRDPSPYVLDRAQGEPTTVYLTDRDTPGTVAALSGVWSGTRFRGERKAEAAFTHLRDRLDFSSLLKKLV